MRGRNVSKNTAHQNNPLKIQFYRVEAVMNHLYMDYMIKQRQQMEIEDCRRRRLLKTAGLLNPGLIHRIVKKLCRPLGRVIARLELRKKDAPIRLSVIHLAKPRKGEEI